MTPYGYRIECGEALINTEEAMNLRLFFKLYLQGYSLADAAHDAGITKSPTAAGMMLSNPVYVGDSFYPRIISDEVFEAAQAEREKRNHRPMGLNRCTFFPVPVATRFRLLPPTALPSLTASAIFSAVYDRIKPEQEGNAADCFQTVMSAQEAKEIKEEFRAITQEKKP